MREILFKAKRLDNDEWVEGNLILTPKADEDLKAIIIPFDDNGEYTEGVYNNDLGFEIWYKVDITTICQYTGLTDKNGKKVWENDVLMFHSNKNDLAKACYGEFYVVDMGSLEKIDSVIGWHYEVMETDAISKCEPFNISMPLTNDYIKMCELEVIGNIFDNPELLEGSE